MRAVQPYPFPQFYGILSGSQIEPIVAYIDDGMAGAPNKAAIDA
jgi:hypothetical protein